MPKKYHIESKEAQPRFTPVGRYGIIDLYETCARGCRNCVKKKCIYDIHRKEFEFTHSLDRPAEFMNECMNCLMCVQNCTRGALTRVENPEYRWLGDEYWKPAQIMSIWKQATTGKIPVSGAGYGGRFSGPGFDSMWTDMSEIVRPTRDGIHGREYISTAVDIGAKPSCIDFNLSDAAAEHEQPLIDLPVPFVIQQPVFGDMSEKTFEAMALAAKKMDTIFAIDAEKITGALTGYTRWLAPRMHFSEIESYAGLIRAARLVELTGGPYAIGSVKRVKEINRGAVVSIKLPLGDGIEDTVVEMARRGAEVLHLFADMHGDVEIGGSVEFIKDVFRRIHGRLVEENIRDRVTLMASGGIAMAEHMAKMIICGADCVALGLPFLVAMECRMCRNCERGIECPVKMSEVPPDYGAQRIMNLAGAWRNQLLEVLGAMGIREVRRLRAEFGRAMFIEDLEKETFIKLFSNGTGHDADVVPFAKAAEEKKLAGIR